jgi:hypothetical protein
MSIWGAITLAIIIAVAGMIGYIRFSPMDPGRWHLDPKLAGRQGMLNGYFVVAYGEAGGDQMAAIYDPDPIELARKFEGIAIDQPRTMLLAGSAETGFMTFVQRSSLIGFPDVISVKTQAMAQGGSSLWVFSRSRFGTGDHGVNHARVELWMAALDE